MGGNHSRLDLESGSWEEYRVRISQTISLLFTQIIIIKQNDHTYMVVIIDSSGHWGF